MSYINHRRPAKQYVTPEQAILRLNTAVDEANAHVAKIKTDADHIYAVAKEEIYQLQAENDNLRAQLAELARLQHENEKLRQEIERLQKQRKKRLKQDELSLSKFEE